MRALYLTEWRRVGFATPIFPDRQRPLTPSWRAAWLGLALASTACTHTVASEDLASFGKAANDIAEQSQLAFADSNKLARDVSIDRFVKSGAPGLSEDSFLVAIDRESLAAWQESLTALSDYSTVLTSLVDTKRGADTSNAIIALGQQLQSSRVGANISPSVQAGFASLGGALVNARAQHQALGTLRDTDPYVQQLLSGMAEALGTSDREGLRGTVFTNWNTSFNKIRAAYAIAARDKQEATQRQLIKDYLSGLDKRDAHLRSLANLRSSLVNLAAAHAAAAKGAPVTVGALLAQVERRLDETKRLYDEAAKNANDAKDKEASNGAK